MSGTCLLFSVCNERLADGMLFTSWRPERRSGGMRETLPRFLGEGTSVIGNTLDDDFIVLVSESERVFVTHESLSGTRLFLVGNSVVEALNVLCLNQGFRVLPYARTYPR